MPHRNSYGSFDKHATDMGHIAINSYFKCRRCFSTTLYFVIVKNVVTSILHVVRVHMAVDHYISMMCCTSENVLKDCKHKQQLQSVVMKIFSENFQLTDCKRDFSFLMS